MQIQHLLKTLDFSLSENEKKELKEKCKHIVLFLKEEIRKKKLEAEVFIGGSYAKDTLIRGSLYDIDVFIRFKGNEENLSERLENLLKPLSKSLGSPLEKVHGSRDYFRMQVKENVLFEFIPVMKISQPKYATNVTDLSYFHVNYIRRALGEKEKREVLLAKQFCKAIRVYGAESYIHGFSGYALECLIAQYGTFTKMLRSLVIESDKIILDPGKKYKKKQDILLNLNESRISGPIILVDPTWNERNVLAALNKETFERFKEKASEFLKNPRKEFFEVSPLNVEQMKKDARKMKGEFIELEIFTDKQEGDIAGTKLKKFATYLGNQLEQSFIVLEKEFVYMGGQHANAYFVLKNKKERIQVGPPKEMEKHVMAFKKIHRGAFLKRGIFHAKIPTVGTGKDFIIKFQKQYSKQIRDMDITKMTVV